MRDTITRRSLIAGSAALAAAVPATSAPAGGDPIFAAIERHKAAMVVYIATYRDGSDLEESLPRDRKRSRIFGSMPSDDDVIVATDDPRWIASERAYFVASEAADELAMALLEIRPTSVAGAAALLRYATEYVDDGHLWPVCAEPAEPAKDWSFLLQRMLAGALEKIAATGGQAVQS